MPPLAVASSAIDVRMTASVLARLINRFLWRRDEDGADDLDAPFTFSALALVFSGAVPVVVAVRAAPTLADVCSEVPRCDAEDFTFEPGEATVVSLEALVAAFGVRTLGVPPRRPTGIRDAALRSCLLAPTTCLMASSCRPPASFMTPGLMCCGLTCGLGKGDASAARADQPGSDSASSIELGAVAGSIKLAQAAPGRRTNVPAAVAANSSALNSAALAAANLQGDVSSVRLTSSSATLPLLPIQLPPPRPASETLLLAPVRGKEARNMTRASLSISLYPCVEACTRINGRKAS